MEVPLNTSLFPLRKLRYRPLSDLTGRRVLIRELADLQAEFIQVLPSLMLTGKFKLRDQTPFLGMIAKYGMLDLTFIGEGALLTDADRMTSGIMRDLGFSNELSSPDEPGDPFLVDNRAFMETIIKDIREDFCFLRIFMCCESYDIGMMRSDNQGSDQSSAAVPIRESPQEMMNRRIESVKKRFPLTFVVEDACLTNCDAAWLVKHFYL
jgi:hypothetical protein